MSLFFATWTKIAALLHHTCVLGRPDAPAAPVTPGETTASTQKTAQKGTISQDYFGEVRILGINQSISDPSTTRTFGVMFKY